MPVIITPVTYTMGSPPVLEESKKTYLENELRKLQRVITELSRQIELIAAAVP